MGQKPETGSDLSDSLAKKPPPIRPGWVHIVRANNGKTKKLGGPEGAAPDPPSEVMPIRIRQ